MDQQTPRWQIAIGAAVYCIVVFGPMLLGLLDYTLGWGLGERFILGAALLLPFVLAVPAFGALVVFAIVRKINRRDDPRCSQPSDLP